MFQRPCRHWQGVSATNAVALLTTLVIWAGGNAVTAAPPNARMQRGVLNSTDSLPSSGSTLTSLATTTAGDPGAAWIRVRFADVAFPGFALGEAGHIRITSSLDGAVQVLDAVNLERWHHRSAYFNGDKVTIEAIGFAGSTPVVLNVAEVTSGFADDAGDVPAARSICGSLDDRVLSSDPRVARIVLAEGDFPSICTATIIGDANRCLLTSGGCAGAMDVDTVIEFNPPLSFPNGTTLMHPSPDDQYVPDFTSIQNETAGDGADWGYFGCFPNSNTSMSPFQAQGDYFELAGDVPAPSDQTVRAYGVGATVPPVFRSWSYVPKEVTGPFSGRNGDALEVETDATAGDSGAAILLDSTGDLIGILTDDGCTEFAGANIATSVDRANLRKALAQPSGVCIPITFSFINGMPEFVNPNGGTTLQVFVSGANGTTPISDSGEFHYNDGSGWTTVAMTEISPDVYEATFAPTACGNFIDYYVSVETSLGVRFPDQIDDPVSTFRTVAATGITQLASFDFEDGTGWTIQDVNVIAGGWELGVPMGNGTTRGPAVDADGSGKCWVTGLASTVDLDGGPTRLRSPTFDLSAANNPFLTFEAWFTTDDALLDKFALQFSSSNGLFWSTVDEFGDQGPGWVSHRYRIADFGDLTTGVRFRFSATDQPNNSQTEAGLDALTIIDYECGSGVTCTKGDFNGDTLRDGRDIAGFASALVSPPMPGTAEFCAADLDDDGTIELGDDLQAFVQCLLLENCP